MKKLILGFLILSIVLIGSISEATVNTEKTGGRGAPVFIKGVSDFTVVIDNITEVVAAGTTQQQYLITNVAITEAAAVAAGTTAIIPGTHEVLGFDVIPLTGQEVNGSVFNGQVEPVASLWDATSGTTTPSFLGEKESGSLYASAEKVFASPVVVEEGIRVHQGPGTRVVIYVTETNY